MVMYSVVTEQQHTISNENEQLIYIIHVQVKAIRYKIYRTIHIARKYHH